MTYFAKLNGLTCEFEMTHEGRLKFADGRKDLYRKIWSKLHLGSDPWGHSIDLLNGAKDWQLDGALRMLASSIKQLSITSSGDPIKAPELPKGAIS